MALRKRPAAAAINALVEAPGPGRELNRDDPIAGEDYIYKGGRSKTEGFGARCNTCMELDATDKHVGFECPACQRCKFETVQGPEDR